MTFQAYNETAVRNLQLQYSAKELLEDGRLTPPQYEQVKTTFPVPFKQVNNFVRIGLFLFTSLCVLFSTLFITWLVGGFDRMQGLGGLLLFFAVTLTALNEYFIRGRHWYRQGSDNALCYAAIICFVMSISALFKIDSALLYALLSLIFLTIATLRYGDPLLAFGAFYALLMSFLIAFDDNELPKIVLPFVCAMLSLFVYFFAKNALKTEAWFYWEDCFKVLEIASLVGLYGSINYLVVAGWLQNDPDKGIPTPYSIIFAFLTAIVPLIFLYIGIQKKDRILWIMGSLGIVASIITYRYYHTIMPIEWALTLVGIALLTLAFFLIKYLKTPRNGFAYQPERGKSNLLESLVVNQFMQQQTPAADSSVKYGGGDFGGGGASDTY